MDHRESLLSPPPLLHTCSAEKQRYMQYSEIIEAGKMEPRCAVMTGCSDRTEKATQLRTGGGGEG